MTWYAAIVGVDDGGPFEVMGPDDTDAETPIGAFHNVHGWWDEVIPEPKMHIRIFDGDEYVYAWVPSEPDVLTGVYSGEIIDLGEAGKRA